MPPITVLLAVYNGADYLAASIDSILGQTFADFELLLVDDASTDTTPDIITSYTDSRIRVLVNDENLGLARSLNEGIEAAARDLVIRHIDRGELGIALGNG